MRQFKLNERQRFSIRKFSLGVASVLLGSVFMTISQISQVQATEEPYNSFVFSGSDNLKDNKVHSMLKLFDKDGDNNIELPKNDPRRELQIPLSALEFGITPNPR